MVQAMIDISSEVNHILNIIKVRYGLKTKSEAIARVVAEYGINILEPELRPEYIEKLKKIESEGSFVRYRSLDEFRKSIENA